MTFVQGLMNAMSKMFVQRAMKIERELLPILRANNSDVVAIRVHRFRNGRNATHMMSNNTVIINFIIICFKAALVKIFKFKYLHL